MQNGCEGLPSIILASRGILVKMLITLEPYRIYEPKFAYLFISIFSSHPGMQNGCEGLPGIILASRGILVKMLITLELNGMF